MRQKALQKLTCFVLGTLASCALKPDPGPSRTKQTCVDNKEKKAALVAANGGVELCTLEKDISCDLRIFSPSFVSDSHSKEQECIPWLGSNSCAQISRWQFSTAALKSTEPAKFFDAGESYNYQEYTCVISKLVGSFGTLAEGKGVTLDGAYASLQRACLKLVGDTSGANNQ
jgi:hypothetical protein